MNFINLLINFLKGKKAKLIELQKYEVKEPTPKNEPSIEIVIENHHSEVFENEEEIIRKNAQITLDEKRVDTLEEGIIVFATIFRGLKYKTTKTDEFGNKKIIFQDIKLENDEEKIITSDTTKRSI